MAQSPLQFQCTQLLLHSARAQTQRCLRVVPDLSPTWSSLANRMCQRRSMMVSREEVGCGRCLRLVRCVDLQSRLFATLQFWNVDIRQCQECAGQSLPRRSTASMDKGKPENLEGVQQTGSFGLACYIDDFLGINTTNSLSHVVQSRVFQQHERMKRYLGFYRVTTINKV